MNPITTTKHWILAAGLALGAVATAGAQTAPAEPNYGLLGSTYVGLEYGYIHNDVDYGPSVAHEYGILYNQNLQPGLDLNVHLDEQRTTFLGTNDRVDEALAGLTAFQPLNSWVKPYVSAQLGVAWTQLPDPMLNLHHGDHFDYVLGAGAEIQATPNLTFTPFAAYQEVRQLDHDWNFGVKAAYRLTRSVSLTLTPQIDQHRNVEYQAGVNYHF